MTQRVPSLLSATGIPVNTDLVARIGQFGIFGYGIIRVTISGPRSVVSLYKSFISESTKFSTVQSGGIADAQFTPPEPVAPGVDIICVWHGGGTFATTAFFNVTTDGGQ